MVPKKVRPREVKRFRTVMEALLERKTFYVKDIRRATGVQSQQLVKWLLLLVKHGALEETTWLNSHDKKSRKKILFKRTFEKDEIDEYLEKVS